MNSCDVATGVENFLHQPSTAMYSYFTQPSSLNNWTVLLMEQGKIMPISVEPTPSIETDFDDSELLKMGRLSIESL